MCDEVVNRLDSGFSLAENLVAVQGATETLQPVADHQGWHWVQRLGAWQIYQVDRSPFDQCQMVAQPLLNQQNQPTGETVWLHPVLMNEAHQPAVLQPTVVVKVSEPEKLTGLEKRYPLTRQLVFQQGHLVFYQLPKTADMDQILHDLSNEIGVEMVKPVIERQRYHLR